MKRVLTAVVLVPLVLLVVFRAPLWFFAMVVAAVAMLALSEYLSICKAYGIEPLPRPTYILTLLLVFETFAYTDPALVATYPWITVMFQTWVVLLAVALIFGIPVIFRRDLRMAISASATSAFALFYIAAPLAVLILFRREPSEGVLLIFVLLSVWVGDTAAFYVGRAFGRHKLAPIVSPKKTWEGAVASVIASVAVSFLVFYFAEPLSRMFTQQKVYFYTPAGDWLHPSAVHKVALGVCTNIAAQLGDLFESALKRGAQMKDSGSLLPGHGGILDRIDALLFAIPAVWYYATFHAYFTQ
jgi:phosphatidate cytidylyltransferase